jgi:hypothetical protein
MFFQLASTECVEEELNILEVMSIEDVFVVNA